MALRTLRRVDSEVRDIQDHCRQTHFCSAILSFVDMFHACCATAFGKERSRSLEAASPWLGDHILWVLTRRTVTTFTIASATNTNTTNFLQPAECHRTTQREHPVAACLRRDRSREHFEQVVLHISEPTFGGLRLVLERKRLRREWIMTH